MAAAGALNTTQLRAAWGPPCSFRSAKFTFWTGVTVTVDARTLDAFRALDNVMRKWNYKPTAPDVGAFVCRRITGGSGYSLHAYGIAVDINWQDNPYSAANKVITDMPTGMVDAIEAIRTRNGKPVWGWGGRYRTIKDTMHYEIVCTPADLATGINVADDKLTKAQQLYWWLWAGKEALKRPFLKPGSESKATNVKHIKDVQRAFGIPQTGVYGPAVVAKVKAFQEFLSIPHRGPAGRMNRRTWQWLIYDVFTRGRR